MTINPSNVYKKERTQVVGSLRFCWFPLIVLNFSTIILRFSNHNRRSTSLAMPASTPIKALRHPMTTMMSREQTIHCHMQHGRLRLRWVNYSSSGEIWSKTDCKTHSLKGLPFLRNKNIRPMKGFDHLFDRLLFLKTKLLFCRYCKKGFGMFSHPVSYVPYSNNSHATNCIKYSDKNKLYYLQEECIVGMSVK